MASEEGILSCAQDMSYLPGSSHDAWQGSRANGAEYAAAAGMMQQSGQQYPQYDPAAAAAAAVAAAAAAAATAVPASLQPVMPSKQESSLPYAAMREASAVNQAADCAADEAVRAIAAAQQTMHAVLNPDPSSLDAHFGAAGGEEPTSSRRRQGGVMHGGASSSAAPSRPNKGLRHFSMKVCEKVESKGTTSYNEVADELVAELKDGTMDDGICYDEKNIRRRVYDAINVLMALDIIAKEKKAIIWKGFPANRTAAQQAQRLQAEQYGVLSEVNRKAQYLSELVEQQRALKHLLERNSKNPEGSSNGTALHLPFILVQSKPDATVEVQISKDMQDVQFNFFNYPFEIHDDALVLKKMLEHEGMQKLAAGAAAEAAAAADPMAAANALMEAAAAAQAMQQQQQQQEMQEQQEPKEQQEQPPDSEAAKQQQQQPEAGTQAEHQQAGGSEPAFVKTEVEAMQ